MMSVYDAYKWLVKTNQPLHGHFKTLYGDNLCFSTIFSERGLVHKW